MPFLRCPEVASARSGDIWLCGPHRVLCGDCTDPQNVARLLGDEQADPDGHGPAVRDRARLANGATAPA